MGSRSKVSVFASDEMMFDPDERWWAVASKSTFAWAQRRTLADRDRGRCYVRRDLVVSTSICVA